MKKVYIKSSKQLGKISYMTEDIEHLISIIQSGYILTTKRPEPNPKLNRDQYSVSFSRNLTAAAKRNPSRWTCGLILDGDILSNHYHIEPYSYANNMYEKGNQLYLKEIKEYDDGSHVVILVHWPTIQISSKLYSYLKQLCENLSDEDKRKMKYTVSSGKRPRNGKLVLERIYFNRPQGGLKLSENTLPEEYARELIHHTAMNEQEERIWTDTLSKIIISDCLQGIVVSKSICDQLYDISNADEEIRILDDVCKDKIGRNYQIATY